MAGIFFTALAFVGMYIPIMPTTPFLLAGAYCFYNGSEKLHSMFIKSEIYRRYVLIYKDKDGIKIKKKIEILFFLSAIIFLSFIFMKNIYGRVCLVAVLILHFYFFLFKIKTKK